MNKTFLLLILLFLIPLSFSTEVGDYRYYTYGQDFNITNWVIDENGELDTGFYQTVIL